MVKEGVCTRYAPSPTGSNGMHIGNLRTALYSWLYARQNNGKFLLRIEDTDRKRYTLTAEKDIYKTLKMFGLNWDSETRQSDRTNVYANAAYYLHSRLFAYVCVCAQDSTSPCNCKEHNYTLSKEHTSCIKLNVRKYFDQNNIETLQMHDSIRHSDIEISKYSLYDIVLLKSDGFPTYHLASVVDDHESGVTDVFRGDEWISSYPYHIIIYNLFRWEIPNFYHLPLITNNGSKLSKRDGAFSVQTMLESGVLPSALLNYIALLGWHPSGNDEIFSLERLLKDFSTDRLNTSSGNYDERKLRKLNLIWSRTEQGKCEFMNQYDSTDDVLKSRLFELFKLGINVNELYKNCNSYHVLSDALKTKETKCFFQQFYDCVYNIPSSRSLMLESEINNIVSRLENDFTKREINIWMRLFFTGNTDGIPAVSLLGILYKNYIEEKLCDYLEFMENEYETKAPETKTED